MIKSFLELGKIIGAHGIKGELRVSPSCDSPEFAKKFKTVYFDEDGKNAFKVISCRPHGSIILMKIEGIDSIDRALSLKDKLLYISREEASLPEGAWFISEIIGCEVFDADTGKKYGKISFISKTGANDVWHINSEDGAEYLIPSVKEIVVGVDVAVDRVYIRPLRGIFDDAD